MTTKIDGILNYDIEVTQDFPKTPEELEERIREIASDFIGAMVTNPEAISFEIERRINNILLESRQRGVIEDVLYCWVTQPKGNPTALNVEVRTEPRPFLPIPDYNEEYTEEEYAELRLEDNNAFDHNECTAQELLESDAYTKVYDPDDKW